MILGYIWFIWKLLKVDLFCLVSGLLFYIFVCIFWRLIIVRMVLRKCFLSDNFEIWWYVWWYVGGLEIIFISIGNFDGWLFVGDRGSVEFY